MLGYKLLDNPFEIYRIELKDSSFCFSISRNFFEHLYKIVTNEKPRALFLGIRREMGPDLVTFFVDLPFITYPNYAHKVLNLDALQLCALQVDLLLEFINYLEDKEADFRISDSPQLLRVATGFNSSGGYHACPVEVGFSDAIYKILTKKYANHANFPLCEMVAFEVYNRLEIKRKRDFEKANLDFQKFRDGITGITVAIRAGGVPYFHVPGNCACLGESTGGFKEEHNMYSHNLDTPQQQMAMLAAIVTFWNSVLKPLSKEVS